MKFKIKKTAYIVFISFLALIGLLVIVSAFPISGNYQIKVVQSGSMEPAMKVGSIVIIKPADSYEVGDIVTFHGRFRLPNGEELAVTHRVVEKTVSGSTTVYKTKGDANDDPDTELLRENKIIGKVLFDVPYIGYVVETARKPYGFLAILIIPASIIIYDQAIVVWKEVKKLRAKREKDLQSENQS